MYMYLYLYMYMYIDKYMSQSSAINFQDPGSICSRMSFFAGGHW